MSNVDLAEDYSDDIGHSTEKAAILLAAIDDGLAVNLLKRLEPGNVKSLLEASTNLRSLKSADVEPVVDEFARDISDALGISAGPQQLMALLESAFSGEEIADILGRPREKAKENVWQKLTVGQEATLAEYLGGQHEQVAAYVMTRLEPELGARCVSLFPREFRSAVAGRMIGIGECYGPAVEILEEVLLEDLFSKQNQKESSEGRKLLAAVINKLDREKSVEVLEELAKSFPGETSELRKLVFMFEDVQLLDQKDRVRLIDRVPAELIIAALFGTETGFRETLLSSMSARTRRMVESELQGDTSQLNKDTLAARRKIADIAILMAQKGELKLPDPDAEPAPRDASASEGAESV
ncbi:MAG: flagellar motor switch protein FliG [Rhizobiales bacterium]|nr:flagellar motor switch protein FliG [Hyphomicrobiales bacterium]